MSRWDAESDLDYQDVVERPYRAVEMHCVNCGVVVFIAREEPYPGPALRCRECVEQRRADREYFKSGTRYPGQ